MRMPGQHLSLRSSARTNRGRLREKNEDRVHIWAQEPFFLAMVADGMGKGVGGDEASRLAVETVQQFLQDNLAASAADHAELPAKLEEALRVANQTILQRDNGHAPFKDAGTTLTVALVVQGIDAYLAHIGDSRAYVVDHHTHAITQLTTDHSVVSALLAAGAISLEEAENHPLKNKLYRALGTSDVLRVESVQQRLHAGDRLVLCSDGLTRHVAPDEIAEIVLSESSSDAAADYLMNLAMQRGGEDDISIITLYAEESAAPRTAVYVNDDETVRMNDRPPLADRHHVFLSYSRRDLHIMQKLRDDLRRHAFRVWTDESLELGTAGWESAVTRAIKNSSCVVVILSPDAERSEWVHREVAMAESLELHILPVLVRGNEGNAVPLRLMSHQWLDARYEYDPALQSLVESIRRHVDV